MLRKPVASAASPRRSVGMPNQATKTARPTAKAAYAQRRRRCHTAVVVLHPPDTSLGRVTARAREYAATVARREQVSPHLVRLVLGDLEGPDAFVSTGIPDEWVGLVVPGQFQSRYYTVRSWDGTELVVDVVVHDEGLVTEWAWSSGRDCVGERVTLSEPKGSFAMSADRDLADAGGRPDRDAGDGADLLASRSTLPRPATSRCARGARRPAAATCPTAPT